MTGLAERALAAHEGLRAETARRRAERLEAFDRAAVLQLTARRLECDEEAIDGLEPISADAWSSDWSLSIEGVPFEARVRMTRTSGGPGEASASDELVVTEFGLFVLRPMSWYPLSRGASRVRVGSLADLGAALA